MTLQWVPKGSDGNKTIQNHTKPTKPGFKGNKQVYIPPPQKKKTDMAMENPAWMSRCKYQLNIGIFQWQIVS